MNLIPDWPQAMVACVGIIAFAIIVIVAWASRSKVWEQVQILQRQINELEQKQSNIWSRIHQIESGRK